MASVRKVDSGDVKVNDFAPSKLFLVVLTVEDAATLCTTVLRWNCDEEQGLERILKASFHLLDEVFA